MTKRIILLGLCVLYFLSGSLSYENTGQKSKELIVENKLRATDKNFFGLLLVPCKFFEANVSSEFQLIVHFIAKISYASSLQLGYGHIIRIICKVASMKWGNKFFHKVTNIFKTFAEESFYLMLRHIDRVSEYYTNVQ